MKTTTQNEVAKPAAHTVYESVAPDVNIYETKDGYVLEAEMPGVRKEGLEITLDGNEITIVGRRAEEGVSGEPLFRERAKADYRRVFEIDPAIDRSRIAARVEQGILTLTLPKAEQLKPRRIEVGD